uniref:Uncharacterized protein n=1 Tax=Anguilla anguilla TaxID=7936 RepID=A0A0E9X8F5_ANGAN
MEISSSDPEDKYGQGFSKQEISPIHWTVPLVLVVLVSCVHFGICFIMDPFCLCGRDVKSAFRSVPEGWHEGTSCL